MSNPAPIEKNTANRAVRICRHSAAATLSTILVLLFSGCAPVGPNYSPPETSLPVDWHTSIGPGLSAAATDPEQLGSWWTSLDDPVLTSIIKQAISGNLNLKQAMARVQEARARRGISQSELFPALDANGSANRSRGSSTDSTRSFYSVGFDAGWEVDIFGGVRRAVEAAEADLAASRENLRDVLVSLSAEVALNYRDTRTFQIRLDLAEKNLVLQQQTFELINARYQAGLSDELALQQARYNLESTRARIPDLRRGLEEAQNRLAVLTGRVPGTMHELMARTHTIPAIPPEVAIGVPAETLRQRPDIRRAERELAARTARIGAATADLYPKFRLAGSIGFDSTQAADLLTSASRTWRIGPSFSWNIFDAGAIRRNIQVQTAIEEQYLRAYEAAVLGGLEEVENAITAFLEEQLRRDRLAAAADAARQAEELARYQNNAGLVDFTAVLDAQRSLFSFEDQLAVSDGTVTADLIRLYKALGGGWNLPAAPELPQPGQKL